MTKNQTLKLEMLKARHESIIAKKALEDKVKELTNRLKIAA